MPNDHDCVKKLLRSGKKSKAINMVVYDSPCFGGVMTGLEAAEEDLRRLATVCARLFSARAANLA